MPETSRPVVIAIDGPAGAGKSSVAKALAERLGIERLDTGSSYRGVAAAALRAGVALTDVDGLVALARTLEIDGTGAVVVDGADVTSDLRLAEVNVAVSVVAATAAVRAVLVERQRAWVAARGGAGVVEGRDIGSVVFPDADVKVYLTASEEERAKRRPDEGSAGVARRDRIDTQRAASPLTLAEGAHLIDTTSRSIAEVAEEVLSWL